MQIEAFMTLRAPIPFLLYAFILSARALDTGTLPTADATGHTKPFEYPKDLREFRARALKVDGAFAPDIAFTIRTCPNPKCGHQYVLGVLPRLSRAPFDDLAAVHSLIE